MNRIITGLSLARLLTYSHRNNWIFIVPLGVLSLAVQALGLQVEFATAQVNQAAPWDRTSNRICCCFC
jgi:hypothetical protein